MKLSEVKREKRVLVLGAGGVGKTHLVGTLCEIIPTLVVTADPNGLETIASVMRLDPEVILIEDWRKCYDYYSLIAKEASSGKYKAIALDDFGSAQESLRHKLEQMPRGKSEEYAARTGKEFEKQVKRELLLGERRLHIDQWGSMWIGLETFLGDVLSLPFDVKLVTVLEGEAENPRDGLDHIYPNLQGAIRYSISARFGLVAEAFIASVDGTTEYALTCRSHPKIETKSRYGDGRTWVNPTMLDVLAYIAGKSTGESDVEKKIGVGIR